MKEVRRDHNGQIDEVVVDKCDAHLERLSCDSWFLSLSIPRTKAQRQPRRLAIYITGQISAGVVGIAVLDEGMDAADNDRKRRQ